MKKLHVLFFFLALALPEELLAIENTESIKATPVITGYTFSRFALSDNETQIPIGISPIVLFPIGQRILLEAELELEEELEKHEGEQWEDAFEKEIEYLQADVIVHKYLTLVGGRFLIPFGTYIERFHAAWIKNLQQNPITFGFLEHSGNGFMARGGGRLNDWMNISYAGYYTFEADVEWVGSQNMFGGRSSAFFPTVGTEVGFSYNGMRDTHEDTTIHGFGVDLSQQFKNISVDLRGEFARLTDRGTGYWIEASHRFVHIPFWKPFFERSQIVLRWEQFFAPTHEEEMEEEEEEGHTTLPEMDTKRLHVGWNYYITNDLKVSLSYGLTMTDEENDNAFVAGVSWRF